METRQQLERKAEAVLELRRRELRRRAESLYVFNNEVLGYHEMAESPHRVMCDGVEQGGFKQLHLYPRGHFKSSMITVGYVLKRVVDNPDIRILIANVTLNNAKAFLREIKGHIDKNEVFNNLYGSHLSKDEKWTETEIISSQRTKNLKEPTIMVAGVGQSLTGMHFDLIIGDDLVNYDTVNTPDQIAKTARWYGDAMSLLEPGGQVILVGTRYNYGDLYGGIIKYMSDEYNPQIHSAITDGEILFPSRFTMETLEGIKKEQGSYMFACQYLNNPVDDENAKFHRSDFRYFSEPELQGKKLFTTMTVDRAYSLAKTADFTGITVRSKDLDGNWYVRYAKRHKDSEGAIIRTIFDLKDYYKVDKVGIEQMAFTQTLKPTLDTEMRRRGVFFRVVELRGRTSKIARIESLVPILESHSLYFTDDMLDLEDEMVRFPAAEHDDVVDALAYHNDDEMQGSPSMEDDYIPEHVPLFGRTGY